MDKIYAHYTASISALKKNPMQVAGSSDGEPIAILNRNHPVFYCIPVQTYAMIMESLENAELYSLAKQKANEERIKVPFDDL